MDSDCNMDRFIFWCSFYDNKIKISDGSCITYAFCFDAVFLWMYFAMYMRFLYEKYTFIILIYIADSDGDSL